jgi:ABC-type multidrug transport system ATPase subunit
MRKAAIDDCWRRVGEDRGRTNRVCEVIQVKDQLNKKHVNVKGIFAIVGANGSGKSSFINFLTNKHYNRIVFFEHQIKFLNGLIVKIPSNVLDAIVIDPVTELKFNNASLLNYKSMFGQQDPIVVVKQDLEILCYALGHVYNKITIEEISISDEVVYPRFVLSTEENDYDNETLSLGEQVIIYIYWVLTKKFLYPGIYFIEEPESGLCPISQYKIADLLAYISDKSGKQIIVTTHSPFIISKIGYDNTIVMKKCVCSEWTHATEMNCLSELGLQPNCTTIYYVEDFVAKFFVERLLDLYGSEKKKCSEIIYLKGESDVYEVISRVASKPGQISFYGILDGDQKNIQKYEILPDKFLFLPGTDSPEQEFIKVVQQHLEDFSSDLCVPYEVVQFAERKCRTLDYHDYFDELSMNIFNQKNGKILESAFKIWFRFYSNRDEIKQFIQSFDSDLTQDIVDKTDGLYFSPNI